MTVLDTVFVVSSLLLVLAGFVMEAAAVRAYFATKRSVMLPLAGGFALIVAATMATAALVFFSEFRDYRLMLFVQNGVAMVGYLLVVYSVIFYRR